jgi:hypothetical protein
MKTGMVRSLTLVVVLLAGLTSCSDRDKEKKIAEMESKLRKEAESKKAVIEFETTEHDFGTINEGDPAEFTYNFKNTGEAPLVISEVKPSCGCTIPDYTKNPVNVGESGFVKVTFDSNNKKDLVTKTVTVIANTEPKQMTLKFQARIVPKPGSAGPVK